MPFASGQFMKFRADEDAMVNHMIYSQNGTVPTAIRELVMNAIDKDADRIDVEISSTHFRVKDTGIGFASHEDVEKHFLTFGTPHQDGDATFGRFRIGRGQIMSLAKAQWHSHEFRMVTDVRNKGNGMELFVDAKSAFKGCDVSGEFYQPINARDELTIRQEVKELVQYLEIPVYLNGDLINDLSDVTWDYEDEDVKVLWEPAGEHRIKLYSLGVYVKDLPIYRYGVSAHVVTKKAFDLNMARNEISASDPLWFKIEELVRKHGQKKSREKASRGQLDDAGRSALIGQVSNGELPLTEIMGLPVLKDIRGHSVKLNQLQYAISKGRPVTVAMKEDHQRGEILATRGVALVLHPDNLRFWGCQSAGEFFRKIIKLAYEADDVQLGPLLDGMDTQTVAVLSEDIDDTSVEIDVKTLDARTDAAWIAAQKMAAALPKFVSDQTGEPCNRREVKVGKSDTNEAWTDGVSRIWVDVRLLKNLHKHQYAADYLAGILLHEYGHGFENSKGHDHDFDFHHAFHEVALTQDNGVLGRVADQGRRQYIASLGQRLERLPKWAHSSYETEKVLEVQLGRVGSGGVSKAAEILLKASGAKVDLKPSKAILMMERSRNEYIPSKIITAFWKALRKDKRLNMDKSKVFDSIQREFNLAHRELHAQGLSHEQIQEQIGPVRDEKVKRVWAQFEGALAAWLKDNDQDESLAYQITKVDNLNDFLNLLCSDSGSDFNSYSYESNVTEYVRGGREFQFKGSRDVVRNTMVFDRSGDPDNLKAKMMGGADKRKETVEQGMFQALMMIEHPMERDIAAKKMLSEGSYRAFQAFVETKQRIYRSY